MRKMSKIVIMSIAAVVMAVSLIAVYLSTRSPSPLVTLAEMQIGEGEIGVLFIGDSTMVLKTIEHTIVVDPASKVSADNIKSLGKVDAILITHEHSDHFVPSVTAELQLASDGVVVANRGAYENLKGLIQKPDKLIELEPDETTTVGGIVVEAIASNHTALSPVMYVISMDNVTILHASDSGFSPSLDRCAGKIDIGLLPTGNPSPTASPLQAFEMADTLRLKKVIPMHGTSAENSELQRLLSNLPQVSFVEVQISNPQKVSAT